MGLILQRMARTSRTLELGFSCLGLMVSSALIGNAQGGGPPQADNTLSTSGVEVVDLQDPLKGLGAWSD